MIKDKKLTYPQIAEQTGLTVSAINQSVRRLRKTGQLPPAKTTDHKWAAPWTVAREHNLSKALRYLRDLSAIAQGKDIYEENRNTALRWAQGIVERGLDVDYDRDTPPNELSKQGGFFLKEADPENWHLKMVLTKAKSGVLKKKL
jgi:transcriptional regulator with XRE-family HTH domain